MDVQFDRLGQIQLKIPIIDFASITYLPDTKSKSQSNFEISFTKDFTLSIEFKQICTDFIGHTLLGFFSCSINILRARGIKVKEQIAKEFVRISLDVTTMCIERIGIGYEESSLT